MKPNYPPSGTSSADARVPPGIVCALATPIADDGAPDLDAMAELVEFQAGAGIQGLFVLGTSGEGLLLPVEERRRVAEFAVKRADGRMAVIVHCGALDTETAAGLARHAQAVGADAVAATAPFFFSYSEESLYRHFAEIAEAAPDVEHFVYENPERVGFAIGVRLVTRLVREVGPVVGVKDTGDSVGRITAYLAQDAAPIRVYTGNNMIVFPALSVGARGAVSALANAAPELFVALYTAWRQGRTGEALDLQLTAARLQQTVADLPYLAAVKRLVDLRGLRGGGLRRPQPDLTAEQAATLRRRVEEREDLRHWLAPVG